MLNLDEYPPGDLMNFSLTVLTCLIYLGVMICMCKYYCKREDEIFDQGNTNEHVVVPIAECSGIKPSILRSIPVVDFNSLDFKHGVECVVCLSKLEDGEKARVLPSCNHCFHAVCIESWFRLNSTCPICRKKVRSWSSEKADQNSAATSV